MENIFKAKLICIRSGSPMKRAGEMMKEHRIRHLPVINTEDRIVGMISKTDLTDVAKFAEFPVDLFSSFPVQTVTADSPLSSVALLMIEKKISSVILSDSNSNAIGIITAEDLLFQLAQILKEKESSGTGSWTTVNTLSTVGEFFRKLSDIGI